MATISLAIQFYYVIMIDFLIYACDSQAHNHCAEQAEIVDIHQVHIVPKDKELHVHATENYCHPEFSLLGALIDIKFFYLILFYFQSLW